MLSSLLAGAQSFFSFLGSSGLAKVLGSVGASFGNSLTSNYFGKSLRSREAQLSYELAAFQSALNYKYNQMYMEDQYNYAQRYAENSASWAVKGLRNAGLNPILAAGGGFNPELGHAGMSSDTSVGTANLSGNPPGVNVAGNLRDVMGAYNSYASAKNLDSQTDLNGESQKLVSANAAKSLAEADSIKVKTDAEALRVLQDALRQGDKSLLGTLFKTTSGEDDVSKSALDSIDNIVKRLGSRYGSNAKDVSSPPRVYERVLESTPIRHSARPSVDTRRRSSRNTWYTDHSKRSIFNQHGNWSR